MGKPIPDAPVGVGDRLLLAYGLTSIHSPSWAVADIVESIPRQDGLYGTAGIPQWKVGYRINVIHENGYAIEQLGVTVLDWDGHDAKGFVLQLDRRLNH